MSEKDWDWMSGVRDLRLSAENQETLDLLQRAIELAQGFALFFASCDQPALREALIARLDARLARQGYSTRRLDVDAAMTGLLTSLQTLCPEGTRPPACVHICGLEKAVSSGVAHPPLLSHLNLARDHYRDLPCPLVFWLPDQALTRLAQNAPDFWAWRSGTFDFRPQWPHTTVTPPPSRFLERPYAEQRIRALEHLLADYRVLPDGPTEQRARANLLVDLADLYRVTYRPQDARQRLDEALPLVRRLGDHTLESRTRSVLRALEGENPPGNRL